MSAYAHLSNLPPGLTEADIDREYLADYQVCPVCCGTGLGAPAQAPCTPACRATHPRHHLVTVGLCDCLCHRSLDCRACGGEGTVGR